MIRKLVPVFVICLLTISARIAAQDNQNSFEIAPFYGLTMFTAEGYQLKGNFEGAEAVFHLNMGNNNAAWVKAMNITDISFAASYRQLQGEYLVSRPGSTGVLGNSVGLVTRLDIALASLGATQLRFVPGFGFTYATQSFYTDNNPLIGSHINFTAQAGFKLVTPLSKSSRLLVGLDIYHYSNAAVKLPNDGVNALNLSLGWDHDLGSQGPPSSKKMLFFKDYHKSAFEFGANIGRRGLIQQGGGLTGANIEYQKNAESKLYKSGFYAGWSYRLNPVIGLRLGTDAVYYYTTLDTISDVHHFYATYQEDASSYDRWRVGLTAGADIWLGRVVFDINYGQYLHFHSYQGSYGTDPAPPNWYWTFGGKYFFNKWLGAEVKQYLHRTEADYAGFGFVVRL